MKLPQLSRAIHTPVHGDLFPPGILLRMVGAASFFPPGESKNQMAGKNEKRGREKLVLADVGYMPLFPSPSTVHVPSSILVNRLQPFPGNGTGCDRAGQR